MYSTRGVARYNSGYQIGPVSRFSPGAFIVLHTELKVMKWHVIVICIVVITTIAACGCTSAPVNQSGAGGPTVSTVNLTLSSDMLSPGGMIPDSYSCKALNISPPLSWQHVPAGAKSLALIVVDTDAQVPGGFTHWIAYNIPVNITALLADQPKVPILPDGTGQGVNSAGGIGYTGPCPPPGSVHYYHFQLYAVDTVLDLKGPVTRGTLESALQGHVLQSTELVGVFSQ
jgi:Raf kinase inhibitor-like YbhB/YbcL family protein